SATVLCRAAHGEAGHHRLGADQLSLRRLDRGCPAQAGVRSLLREELHALSRSADPASDPARDPVAGRGAVMAALWALFAHLIFLCCAGVSLAAGGWILSKGEKRGPAAIAEAA